MGVMRSLWRGMKHKEFQGDVKQQGGALVVGPGTFLFLLRFATQVSSQ